jgi:2-oxoacid:acceptor oxidoreductase delta subunit (pyruvate/2-ketoisovalerate family)
MENFRKCETPDEVEGRAGRIKWESRFGRVEAMEEAQRCLGSRGCDSCDICAFLCPDLCITRDEQNGNVIIDLDFCKGCGICAAVCPKGAIRMVME